MGRPRIVVSAVSSELGRARAQVAETLRTLGFDPVTQDDFPTGHGARPADRAYAPATRAGRTLA
jgi:hypothetical protein